MSLLLGTNADRKAHRTGTNSINYYAPQIFKSVGLAGQSAGLFATGKLPSEHFTVPTADPISVTQRGQNLIVLLCCILAGP